MAGEIQNASLKPRRYWTIQAQAASIEVRPMEQIHDHFAGPDFLKVMEKGLTRDAIAARIRREVSDSWTIG